ncbi:MAG: hypothetical protein AABN33_01195 [Acidobacteriota bacterium]
MRLQVTDVSRAPLKSLHEQRLASGTSTVVMNLEVLFDAGQVYGVSVDVKKHRAAWQLINHRSFFRQEGAAEIEVNDIGMRLMLVPRSPTSSDLEEGYSRLSHRGSPIVADKTGLAKQEYLKLSPERKMALLNIEAKLRETRMNGVPLLSFVEGVRYVDVDRLFLFVRAELKHIVETSSEFAGAPGHPAPKDTPIALPPHRDSWKHKRFGAGNLQLSFSEAAETLPGDSGKQGFSVDADIDLAQGLEHVPEWLKNHFSGKKTDQTLVYTLLFNQRINPEYTLDPVSGK